MRQGTRTWFVGVAALLLWYVSGGTAHECVHHKLKHEESLRSAQKYKQTGPAQLRGASHMESRRNGAMPIRVTFDVSQLGLNIDQSKKNYIEKVLVEAEKYIEDLLRVIPVEGNLYVSRPCRLVWKSGPNEGVCAEEASSLQCGTMEIIPDAHLGEMRIVPETGDEFTLPSGGGVPDTDLLVYVTASAFDDICLQSEALAYANSCQRDQRDRPVVSYINFCSDKVTADLDSEPTEDDVKLALHELTHILGMSQSSYPFWRDENGEPRTQRCPESPLCGQEGTDSRDGDPPRDARGSFITSEETLTLIQTDGGPKDAIVTPTVREVVRAHFNCSGLEGAELEDAGGAGTQLSHWEKRVYYTEYMTGSTQSGTHGVVSMVTLALLQDTGWYEVEFEKAGRLLWGSGQGCSFVTGRCPEVGCSAENQEDQDAVCAFDRSAIGYCASDPLMDGCAVVLPFSDQSCSADESRVRVRCEGEDCLGSAFGADSACFESSLKLEGFQAPYASTVSCYQHRCSVQGEEDVLEIETPDGVWHQCLPGKLLQAEGYGGRIMCPETGQLCGSEFAGPALPSARLLIPLDLDAPSDGGSQEPLDFLTEASVTDWALYGGAGAGALASLCLCISIYKWRKRSTSGVSGMLGFKRKDRWANGAPIAETGSANGALAFGAGQGERRTSAEMQFDEAMRRQVGELTLDDILPSEGAQQQQQQPAQKKSSGCVVM